MSAPPSLQHASRRLQHLRDLNPRAVAELRREQLIKVAAYIVEFEGIDALKHARIAEIAGCARPLVYKYFPARSDIYVAISEAFYQRLTEQFSCEEQYEAVLGALTGESGAARALESLVWDVVDEFGCAGMILRAVPEINEEFREYHTQLRERYEYRWLRYFLELGIGEARAHLLLDNCVAISKNAAQAYTSGTLGRQESIELVLDNMAALIRREAQRAKRPVDVPAR